MRHVVPKSHVVASDANGHGFLDRLDWHGRAGVTPKLSQFIRQVGVVFGKDHRKIAPRTSSSSPSPAAAVFPRCVGPFLKK